MNSSPFIAGDARVLSGGFCGVVSGTYDLTPCDISPGEPVLEYAGPDGDAIAAARRAGQVVYCGRGRYHASHSQGRNTFTVEDDPLPTVGVELETIAFNELSADDYSALRSNWFRFENDGSLGPNGHELITDPLPSRVYRDLRTWVGLRNLLVGRLRSYRDTSTGLHVHVGLSRFNSVPARAFKALEVGDRRGLGGLMAAAVYFALLDRTFLDGVFLRRNTSYCDTKIPRPMLAVASVLRSGGMSAYDLMDSIIRDFSTPYALASHVCVLTREDDESQFNGLNRVGATGNGNNSGSEFSGHNSEINLAHSYTIEFRRGKGTLNGESIHRMADFCSLVVRYAEMLALNPETRPTRKDAYGFIIDNTASQSLKELAEAARKETN